MADRNLSPSLDRVGFARELLDAASPGSGLEAHAVAVALTELLPAAAAGEASREEALRAVERFFEAAHPADVDDVEDTCRVRVRACAFAWAAGRPELYRRWVDGRDALPDAPADYYHRLLVRLVECWEILADVTDGAISDVVQRTKAEQTALEASWLTEPEDLYTRQTRALYAVCAYNLLGAVSALAAGESAKAQTMHRNAAKTGEAGVLDGMLGHELGAAAAFTTGVALGT